MSLLNKLRLIANSMLLNWVAIRDDQRADHVYYLCRTTHGDYIVQDEGDGTWSWVLCDGETGQPLDLGATAPSLDAAKESAEKHFRRQ